jgi:hypothetical protein
MHEGDFIVQDGGLLSYGSLRSVNDRNPTNTSNLLADKDDAGFQRNAPVQILDVVVH